MSVIVQKIIQTVERPVVLLALKQTMASSVSIRRHRKRFGIVDSSKRRDGKTVLRGLKTVRAGESVCVHQYAPCEAISI